MAENKFLPLLLVRHGEAEHHLKPITGGWTDSELTHLGQRQCQLLAERLEASLLEKPRHLLCSDLKRAVQTAHILSEVLELVIEIQPGLKDLNNGMAAGLTHLEAREIAIAPTDPIIDWRPYPQAESWRQFYQRIVSFMQAFTARQNGLAVLVSHSAVIHVIVAWWLDLGVESPTHFEIHPASLTVLTMNRWGEHTVERMNDTAHLYQAGLCGPIRLD
jgi:probable phosphoglycerate mutase